MTRVHHVLFLVILLGWSYSLTTWPGPPRVFANPADALSDSVEAGPERLVLGIAATPFQYRVLVPWMVRAYSWIDPGVHVVSAFAVIEFLSLVGLGFAFRRYVAFFVPGAVLASVLALSIYLLLPLHFRLQNSYPYNVPSVLFLTVALILIYERRWMLFYPVFVLATINRETSIFLVMLTALVWAGREPIAVTLRHVAAQSVIFAAIKAALFAIYRDNPVVGEGLWESQWKMNAALILYLPQYAVSALSVWGYLWIPVVLGYRHIQHVILRRTLWVVPIFVIVVFFVGVINQTRLYAEMLPIVLAAAWVVGLNLLNRLGVSRSR